MQRTLRSAVSLAPLAALLAAGCVRLLDPAAPGLADRRTGDAIGAAGDGSRGEGSSSKDAAPMKDALAPARDVMGPREGLGPQVPAVALSCSAQQVSLNVPTADYQAVFDAAMAQGFYIQWQDSHLVGSEERISGIFHKGAISYAQAWSGLTLVEYQQKLPGYIAAKVSPVHVEMNPIYGALRYTLVFHSQQQQPFLTKEEQSPAEFEWTRGSLSTTGYWPATVSVAEATLGVLKVTATFEKYAVGTSAVEKDLDPSAFEGANASYNKQGLYLRDLNAHLVGGAPRFSGVWRPIAYSAVSFQRDRDLSAMQQEIAAQCAKGLPLRMVAGYPKPGSTSQTLFVAFWAK